MRLLKKYNLELVIVEIMKLFFSQTFFTHPLPPLFRGGKYMNKKGLSVSPSNKRGSGGVFPLFSH